MYCWILSKCVCKNINVILTLLYMVDCQTDTIDSTCPSTSHPIYIYRCWYFQVLCCDTVFCHRRSVSYMNIKSKLRIQCLKEKSIKTLTITTLFCDGLKGIDQYFCINFLSLIKNFKIWRQGFFIYVIGPAHAQALPRLIAHSHVRLGSHFVLWDKMLRYNRSNLPPFTTWQYDLFFGRHCGLQY